MLTILINNKESEKIMTVRIIETKVYTIESHPEPHKVFDWIRSNWHNLGDHCLHDAVNSLKAFASYFGASVDYSISLNRSRGEHITFDRADNGAKAREYMDLDLSVSCPFTGVYYDEILLHAFRDSDNTTSVVDMLEQAGVNLLSALHGEGEYIYSDEGLRDMCEANEYEFNVDGSAA